ncbi:arginase [Romboutsia maritimum]|uniref:Arginase n=1 Tax=Romboutsia maritimum TaxID=2020948 RepID=A0A255I201_9FIRM|nr:arginase [Romboutsia maritimum]RDY24115.1 arginase [Romboutsia maritimum]
MNVADEANGFWEMLKKRIKFPKSTKIVVSESHAMAYYIAKENGCDSVYSFDAHSDLGYGGIKSLDFEVNCANWLGKLLNDKIVSDAKIIYSPYTNENPNDFEEINNSFDISYCGISDISCKNVSPIIHICRSGCWSAPWLDKKLLDFVEKSSFKYTLLDCEDRLWNPNKINLAQQIDYMLYG